MIELQAFIYLFIFVYFLFIFFKGASADDRNDPGEGGQEGEGDVERGALGLGNGEG